MHELPLTRQIVRIVLDAAQKENALRVIKVNLVLGESAGVVEDCVKTYYDLLAKGTVAEGAALFTRAERVTLRCKRCDTEFLRAHFSFTCPDCGLEGTPTGKGHDCFVESVELET